MNFKDYSNDKKQVASNIAYTWSEWDGLREGAKRMWQEIDSYIHATDTMSIEGGQNFTHTVMIPVVSEIHEDLLAIMYSTIFPHNDWLGWKPYDQQAASVAKREKVLNYLKHIHALNDFYKVYRTLIDDLVRYGNPFVEVQSTDERMMKEDGTFSAGYVGAKPKRISPYDIVFNPKASNFDKTDKIVRSIVHVSELLDWYSGVVPEGDKEALRTTLRERKGSLSTGTTSNVNKDEQYVPSGFSSYENYITSGYVEVLTFYGDVFDEETYETHKNRMICVIDGNEVIVDKPLEGRRIFKGSWKARPDNLWSQGALDSVIGLNYMINHRENSKNEAIDRFIHPDRLYQGEVEEVFDEVTGQMKYLAPENGMVQDIQPNTAILSYNNEVASYLELARRAARLPQQLSGFRSAGEKTAFEVQTLNDGAFRGFINKAEQFEQDLLEPSVTAELDIARDNFQSVLQVSKKNEEGLVEFLEVTEEDLKSNGKLVPYGSRRFSRLLQQQAGLNQLSQSQLGQMIAPHMSTWKVANAVEHVYGFEDFDMFGKFVSVEEQLEAQEAQAMAQNEFAQSQGQPTAQELALQQEEDEMLMQAEQQEEGGL